MCLMVVIVLYRLGGGGVYNLGNTSTIERFVIQWVRFNAWLWIFYNFPLNETNLISLKPIVLRFEGVQNITRAVNW